MVAGRSVIRCRAATLFILLITAMLGNTANAQANGEKKVDGSGKGSVTSGESTLADTAGGSENKALPVEIDSQAALPGMRSVSKAAVLVGSFTVFLLAVFVGFEVITKVPPTLHTPLMSGSNAISGIIVVGAILTAGHSLGGFGSFMGMLAVVLAMINIVGGFLVTHRMLIMFKKR
jgi:H+-translocating NAD(P) transhydrogenase subunit alpha